MIWIIAGTVEASQLSQELGNHSEVLYTVATPDSLQFLNSDNVYIGRKTEREMKDFAIEHQVKLIVDMSHPFAEIVTKNAKVIAKDLDIEYLRFNREENAFYSNGIYVKNYKEAYEKIKDLKGNFLFTTGSKHVEDFQKIKGKNRFIFRVLPTVQSMKDLKDAGVEMRDSIGMLGPFTMEMNLLLLKQYNIDYLVTKESGKSGGVDEKIEACKIQGVKPIIISRSKEDGIDSLKELRERIEGVL